MSSLKGQAKKNESSSHAELGDFTTDGSVVRLCLLAFGIGALSAVVAWVLIWLIAVITNLSYFGKFSSAHSIPAQSHFGVWMVFIPVVGGLIIGFMARYGSEKIRGHGIPEALEAILVGKSAMEPKIAILKPLSSAISIGTGGPFGAEGPIIMTGGACGSIIAQFIKLSSAERKTLLVAGAAGGMAAVFATPMAAVLLAVELLLFEWKPRSLAPVACASIAAAGVRVLILGAGPIFPVPAYGALNLEGLCIAGVLGLLCGFGSGLLTIMVYYFEDLFPKLKIHWMWWPAIGGLVVGLGGLVDPRVLGVGYDTINLLIQGKILGVAALTLLVGKAFVWSFALGSNTSGGVLAPLLMIGAAIGALVGQVLPIGSPGLWALIGMAAMMGGMMRAPLAAAIFSIELTGSFNLLPALLIACVGAQVVSVLWMKRSILTEKLARRGHHLTREYTVDPFEVHRIEEIMESGFATIEESTPIEELGDPAFPGFDWFAHHSAIPVADKEHRIVGILTQSDYLKAVQFVGSQTALEAGTTDLVTVRRDEVVRAAVVKMLENKISRLLVVDEADPRMVVGYVDRASVMDARQRWYEEEHVRERQINVLVG